MSEQKHELTDEQAEYICRTIARGFGPGAFPMDEDGHQVGWFDWLRAQISAAPGAQS